MAVPSGTAEISTYLGGHFRYAYGTRQASAAYPPLKWRAIVRGPTGPAPASSIEKREDRSRSAGTPETSPTCPAERKLGFLFILTNPCHPLLRRKIQ